MFEGLEPKGDGSNCFPWLPSVIIESYSCVRLRSAMPVGGCNMRRSVTVRLLFSCLLEAALLTGCSRNPNARKQEDFDRGEKYFAQGKYREAVIQYSHSDQIDPRVAQEHAQSAHADLKIGDRQRAYHEL